MAAKPLGTVIYGLLHGCRVSPMPRTGRNVAVALAISLVVATLLLVVPAVAQETNTTQGGGAGNAGGGSGTGGNGTGDGGAPVRRFTVRAEDTECAGQPAPCWDVTVLPVRAGDEVVVTIDLSPSAQPHNFHVEDPIGQKTDTQTGTVQELRFTVPDDARQAIEFVCDVHDTTMVGIIAPPEALASLGQGHGEEVPHMGVHFLAYWVGVIAFAILFLVYGITFFLFKYNETSATTDHWDRTGAGAPGAGKGKRLVANAFVLALAIAVIVVAAIVYLEQREVIVSLSSQLAEARSGGNGG